MFHIKPEPKANPAPISDLKLSENESVGVGTRQEMIDAFKISTNYKKDEDASIYKRVRWSKIRHEAGGDTAKIAELKAKYANENLNIGPFPKHWRYSELRVRLNPEQQKIMEENIRISDDGKIEMIKMRKKFSILTAKHNGTNIFEGEYKDEKGKEGIRGVTYLTGRAAENECDIQKKSLLKDKAEVEQFIGFFPGEFIQEKISNFVSLFGLKTAGIWNSYNEVWSAIGKNGFVGLSRVSETEGSTYGAGWNDGNSELAGMNRNDEAFPTPFVAYEDC